MRAVKILEPNIDKTPYKDYEIKFKKSHGELGHHADKIFVIATIELLDLNLSNRYVVNVANITSSGFIARVTRLDGNEGWDTKLQLNYMVSTCTIYN